MGEKSPTTLLLLLFSTVIWKKGGNSAIKCSITERSFHDCTVKLFLIYLDFALFYQIFRPQCHLARVLTLWAHNIPTLLIVYSPTNFPPEVLTLWHYLPGRERERWVSNLFGSSITTVQLVLTLYYSMSSSSCKLANDYLSKSCSTLILK